MVLVTGQVNLIITRYGLPDSGSVYDPGHEKHKCEICNGIGYTNREIKPVFDNPKIIGYL